MWKEVAKLLAEDLAKDGESLILMGEGGPSLDADASISDCSPSTLRTMEAPTPREIRKYLWEMRRVLADLGDKGGVWGSLEEGVYEVGVCRVDAEAVTADAEGVPHGQG